ncbi:PREDICTED: thrombospondin type-1 domain-containing protein 4-like [Ceratosolen solmsi marchali]|uniref:Thrombospondin type-1 domain-containing protein 4-like n=1 Tax=Ceratosolen solmsi marchali TaxID=326594 RepID=A0AAJ6VJZ9_9HYME|nr:PREDICTED: thrombospondin type-1 domain-containing protein 4-like [Ceratosolen solmsi marchali]
MPRSFSHVLLLLLTYSASIEGGEQIEGIFSEKLQIPGYYVVTTIPEGATSINVTELTRTKNFLSIRLQNGSYLFNANNNIDWSNTYKGAGTNFVYIRRSEHYPETFYAAGPLNSSVDVMLLYQQYEPKIFFQYELPVDLKESVVPTVKSLDADSSSQPTQLMSTISDNLMLRDEIRSSTFVPRRRRKRKFVWRAVGFGKCSKTCGGGFQTKRYICTRLRSKQQVSNRKCELLEKPKVVIVRCNSGPCEPEWEAGQWSKCSVTCGNGTRTRELQCVQEMSDKLQVRVENDRCPDEPPMPIHLQEVCYMPDCNIYTTPEPTDSTYTKQYDVAPQWKTEKWSPCSTTCGNGKRTRLVICVTLGRTCNAKFKPSSEEFCNLSDCKTKPANDNEIPEALIQNSWMYSAWPEQCPAECGTGTMSRRLYCENFLKNQTCDEKKMPIINRTCVSSSQTCGQWFTGPWTQCSSSCDIGFEIREVVCVSKFLGSSKVVAATNCPSIKPETIRECMGPPCNATWFMSDWSQCSRSCGRGFQKREVKCIGPDGMPINASESECDEENRPVNRRNCNQISCNRSNIEKTNSLTFTKNGNDIENECLDTFSDCSIIRYKASESKRRCQMEIYQKGCCKACRYYAFLSSNG